jgi:hypothetical protein
MDVLRRLACAGLLAAGVVTAYAQAPTRATAVERVGDAVVLQGRIDAAMAERAVRLLQDPDVARLVVTSGGGLVDAALDIAEAVHAHGTNVEVPVACLSSCASYIFPAGRHKLLGRADAVAWHGNMAHVLHLQRTGQGSWSDAQLREARRLAQREAGFYARIGVDSFVSWFAKLPPYSVDEFYSLSIEDMEHFGIRNLLVREAGLPLSGGLVQQVRVDWQRLEAMRPKAAPDP